MFPVTVKRIVSIHNAHPRLRVPRGDVRRAIGLLDRHAEKFLGGCPPGELSLVFLTDPALARIHAEFMDDPAPTDVITFEGRRAGQGSGDRVKAAGSAGEICVSADTAARFVGLPPARASASPGFQAGRGAGPSASARRRNPARQTSFAAELTLYLVHGWLHLAGYDDREAAHQRRMRAAEKRAMGLLRNGKAVPAFGLA